MSVQRQLRLLNSEEPAMEAACKVAFATSDLKHIDQHFGSSERFAIYAVEPDGANLLEVAEFGRLAQDGDENKLKDKFVLLSECIAVYCLAVGPSAVRQLVAMDIQPVKVADKIRITQAIEQLQRELCDGGIGWVARALERRQAKDPNRFAEMEHEEWAE